MCSVMLPLRIVFLSFSPRFESPGGNFSTLGSHAIMLWAVACMCFFGFLQSGEVVVPSDTTYDESVHFGRGCMGG